MIVILIVTVILLYNIYYDNKLILFFKHNIKYVQMSIVAFLGFSLYIFFKKYPKDTNELLNYTNNIMRYVPIDKNSKEMLKFIHSH